MSHLDSLISILENPLIETAMTKEERDALPDSEFGLPSQRKYPLHDADHVRIAIKYFWRCPEEDRKELAHNIKVKADKFGIEIGHNTLVWQYLSEKDRK